MTVHFGKGRGALFARRRGVRRRTAPHRSCLPRGETPLAWLEFEGSVTAHVLPSLNPAQPVIPEAAAQPTSGESSSPGDKDSPLLTRGPGRIFAPANHNLFSFAGLSLRRQRLRRTALTPQRLGLALRRWVLPVVCWQTRLLTPVCSPIWARGVLFATDAFSSCLESSFRRVRKQAVYGRFRDLSQPH